MPEARLAELLGVWHSRPGFCVPFPDTDCPVFGHLEAVALHLRVEVSATNVPGPRGLGPFAVTAIPSEERGHADHDRATRGIDQKLHRHAVVDARQDELAQQ
jgi:hypothetical protein